MLYVDLATFSTTPLMMIDNFWLDCNDTSVKTTMTNNITIVHPTETKEYMLSFFSAPNDIQKIPILQKLIMK